MQASIKNNLIELLKAQCAFWSYQPESIAEISDEILIEKTLIDLDIEDINKLFLIFPPKKIKEVWRNQLCIQEPHYHNLNIMLAYLYFDIKKPEQYLKNQSNRHIKTLKYKADEWFNKTY